MRMYILQTPSYMLSIGIAFGMTVGMGCSKSTSKLEAIDSPKKTFHPKEVAEQLATRLRQPIDIDDPEACATCHGVVYSEWLESMHAQAHHSQDPIYAAMRTFRLSKGQKILGKCENCHAPRSGGNVMSPAAKTGVSCATCHNVRDVRSRETAGGAKQIVTEEDRVMRSARDVAPGRSPVHGNGPALAAMTDGKSLCLACHGVHTNPAKVPVCTTGSELEAHAGEDTCVSCHMPPEDGPSGAVSNRPQHRSHRFLGPHRAYLQNDPELLTKGVSLEATILKGTVQLMLHNHSGHSFPSGFPGRLVVVKVEGMDSEGNVVWQNFSQNPIQESPVSVLNKIYLNAQGEPTMPPLATQLGRDNRLTPNESRMVEFQIPRKVKRIRAALLYYLLAPRLAETLKLSEHALAKPVIIATTDDDRSR